MDVFRPAGSLGKGRKYCEASIVRVMSGVSSDVDGNEARIPRFLAPGGQSLSVLGQDVAVGRVCGQVLHLMAIVTQVIQLFAMLAAIVDGVLETGRAEHAAPS